VAAVAAVAAGLLGLALPGCHEEIASRGAEGPGSTGALSVVVSALGTSAVTDAVYTVEVFAGAPGSDGALVASVPGLRSTRYGDGAGALTYVAPCDARAPGAPNGTVRLTLEGLYGPDEALIDPASYHDPTPLERAFTCEADADATVAFEITLARRAEQGFFDVAVGFAGMFCSAKFDCVSDEGGPIELLHDPLTESRGATLVLGFACTAGPGKPTWLRMSDVHIACGAGEGATIHWLSPLGTQGGASGNQGAVAPVFFQTALYQGAEELPGVEKCYWNMAFGLSGGAPADCRLVVDASASEASWADTGGRPPDGGTYPYIHYEVPITGPAGELACAQHALDAPDGQVATRYTEEQGGAFPFEWRCGEGPLELPRLACGGASPQEQVTFSQSPSAVSVAFGASRSPAYTLPDGLHLDDCCLNPCCAD